MVTIEDINIHLEKRSTVPRVLYGIALVLILGIVCIFGYYVWVGMDESSTGDSTTTSRMSDADAAKLRAEIVASSAAPMPRDSYEKITQEIVSEQSSMSEADAQRLRAQLFE